MNRMDWNSPGLVLSSIHRAELQVVLRGSLDHLECRGSWHLLQHDHTRFLQLFLHTLLQFQWHLGSWFFPILFRPPHHSLGQKDLLLLALLFVQLVLVGHWHLAPLFLPYLQLVPEVPSLLSVLEVHEDQEDRLAHPFHPSLAIPQCWGESLCDSIPCGCTPLWPVQGFIWQVDNTRNWIS